MAVTTARSPSPQLDAKFPNDVASNPNTLKKAKEDHGDNEEQSFRAFLEYFLQRVINFDHPPYEKLVRG